jgi:hypothetical protein
MERAGQQKIFSIQLIISPNGEDHRTTKQDFHLSILYLQMERTTGPQKKIFTYQEGGTVNGV